MDSDPRGWPCTGRGRESRDWSSGLALQALPRPLKKGARTCALGSDAPREGFLEHSVRGFATSSLMFLVKWGSAGQGGPWHTHYHRFLIGTGHLYTEKQLLQGKGSIILLKFFFLRDLEAHLESPAPRDQLARM